jgi:NADH dehydrogenase FAD-containing subunit
LSFDELVTDTGTRWNNAIESTDDFGDDYKAYFGEQHKKIETSKHIVLIGGGFNNTELAGELLDKYGEQCKKGEKKVTIVHSSERMLMGNGIYCDKMQDRITDYFRNSPIELKLGSRASISEDDSDLVTLSNGGTSKEI